MLFERVVIKEPEAEKESWDCIPDPIGYRLADGAELALATKIAGGTKAVGGMDDASCKLTNQRRVM